MNSSVHFLAMLCATWLAAVGGDGRQLASAEAAVDEILDRAHQQAGLSATETCDDLVFLRRVTLDLLGRVPTVAEWNAFNRVPDREQLIDRHLASTEFSAYWSQLWATILVGRGQRNRSNREALRQWLQEAFEKRQPLDQIAYDLIASQGVTVLDGQVNFLTGNREDPVTPTCRIFLGVQLDCARCHDHPYDRWTQDDYARMRRFFQTVQYREVSGGVEVFDNVLANNDPKRSPRFLTGAEPRTGAWRKEFALLTVRCKPFARSMGNRVWQLLLGRGIVHPVDGLSRQQPPSVAELHEALAEQLRTQRFDLRRLVKTICLSEAYARTDRGNDQAELGEPPPGDAETREYELFAARKPRPLLPEQLVASYWSIQNDGPLPPEAWNQLSIEFGGSVSAKAGATDPLELQRTSQGLLRELASATRPTGLSIDDLYVAAIGRRPDESERSSFSDTDHDDLLYALLHCNEFVFSR